MVVLFSSSIVLLEVIVVPKWMVESRGIVCIPRERLFTPLSVDLDSKTRLTRLNYMHGIIVAVLQQLAQD